MNPELKVAIAKTRASGKKRPSQLEEAMMRRLEGCTLGRPDREFRFHEKRRWVFDFAYPEHRIAIETEGGAFTQGRHTRGVGFIGDIEKYNSAVILGWSVLRYTDKNINDVEKDIREILLRKRIRI